MHSEKPNIFEIRDTCTDEGNPDPIGKQAKIKLVALPTGIRYSNLSKPKSPEEIWADAEKNAGEDIDEEHLSRLNTLVAEYESWLTRLRA